MNHTYILGNGSFSIRTPGIGSLSDVVSQLVEQDADHIVWKSTYPNGFEITFNQQADIITITCNRELIRSDDSTLIAPTL